jgi:hypothetical protein
VISGRPQGAARDLERYWGRSVGEPRVALSRVVRAGEPAGEIASRLRADPASAWASTLLVQTQPTRCELAAHLGTLAAAREAVTRGGTRPRAGSMAG